MTGTSNVIRHFAAEYASVLESGADRPPTVDVVFNAHLDMAAPPRWSIQARHKLTRWRAGVDVSAERLHARISVTGYFGLPLAQSQIVEPLLAVGAHMRGMALIPAMALAASSRCVLVVGSSGTGKTTLALRSLLDGWEVVSDDQVMLDGDGLAWPFPRRLRVYPQTIAWLPDLAVRLSHQARIALQLRRAEALVTGRRVRLPVLISSSEVRQAMVPMQQPHAPACVVLLQRAAGALQVEPADSAQTLRAVVHLMNQHRSHLPDDPYFTATEQEERRVLGTAFEGIPAFSVAVPQFRHPDDVRELLAVIRQLTSA